MKKTSLRQTTIHPSVLILNTENIERDQPISSWTHDCCFTGSQCFRVLGFQKR